MFYSGLAQASCKHHLHLQPADRGMIKIRGAPRTRWGDRRHHCQRGPKRLGTQLLEASNIVSLDHSQWRSNIVARAIYAVMARKSSPVLTFYHTCCNPNPRPLCKLVEPSLFLPVHSLCPLGLTPSTKPSHHLQIEPGLPVLWTVFVMSIYSC